MVLPGCLCQVLEPLGIHVPHHHHGVLSGWTTDRQLPLALQTEKPSEPTVPCHCDERLDRDADDCVVVCCEAVQMPVPSLHWVPVFMEVPPAPVTLERAISSRGPPPVKPSSATMRKLLCVYLL